MRNILTLALTCLALNAVADDYTFRLKNTLGFARQNETVEVEIPTDVDLSRKQLTDEHGHVLPYELCGSHGIRFQASVPHGTSVAFSMSDGSNRQPTKLTYAAITAPT